MIIRNLIEQYERCVYIICSYLAPWLNLSIHICLMCCYMISQYAICGCFVFFKTREQKSKIEMEIFFK